MRFRGVWIGLLICLLGSAAANGQSPDKVARVSIFATGRDGRGLANGEVKSFKSVTLKQEFVGFFDQSRKYGRLYHGIEAANIPYGEYTLVLSADGFRDVERPVHVSEPYAKVTVSVMLCTVHLVVVNADGAEMKTDIEVESFQHLSDDTFDLADHFQGNVGQKIPYGRYELRTKLAGDHTVRWVDVYNPDIWVLIDLNASFFDISDVNSDVRRPEVTLSGIAKNVDSVTEPVYVRLIGAFPRYVIDTKMDISDGTGTFSLLGDIPLGKYVLLVVSQGKTLAMKEVEVPRKEPIVVDLGAGILSSKKW